jgi:uncharacterized protein with FMN-binding domain
VFPKRGAIAMLVTAIALVALLGYKTPELSPPGDQGAYVGYPTQQTSAVQVVIADPGLSSPASGDQSPAATSTAGASEQSAGIPSDAAVVGPTPTPSPAPTPVKARGGSSSGSIVNTRYGPVQVEVVYQNGKITDVIALQTPSAASTSRRINSWACPILLSEVLAAQGASIDTVSGATYTSDGYKTSLQYAIDHP